MTAVTWLTQPPAGLAEPQEIEHTTSEDWSVNLSDFATRVSLMCDWNSRHGVLFNILDNARTWPYLDGDLLRAVTGRITPYLDSTMSIATTNFPGGLGYAKARVDVDFKAVQYNPTTRAIYSERLAVNNEMLSLPPKEFKWGSGPPDNRPWLYNGKKVTQAQLDATFVDGDTYTENPTYTGVSDEETPSRFEFGFDYVLTFYNVPAPIPDAAFWTNKVNDRRIYSPSLNKWFDRGTLLLNPSDIQRMVSFGGANRYTIEARFSYREQGWANFWRVRTGSYDQLYLIGNNTRYLNFPEANLSGLLP